MTNRKFVPENFNVDNEDEVKALYQSLLDEDVANSPEALRSWILKWCFRKYHAAAMSR